MDWDVAGIGNALMDALVILEDDSLLTELGIQRGMMHPVDHDGWEAVYNKVRDRDVVFDSGGSCANAVANAGRLGAKALYRGQVGDDQMGQLYGSLLEKHCGGHALKFQTEHPTGKCLSLVSSSDAERTMLTDLGAAVHLADLDAFADDLRRTKIAHFEGYTLLDGPINSPVLEAMRIAKESGAKVSIDASDPFVVHTVKDRLATAVREFADIVFLNAEEARLLTDLDDPLAALRHVRAESDVSHVAVKLGGEGSLVSDQDDIYRIQVYRVDAKDTTGAGDAFAGGFLYGLSQGWDTERAGRLASAVAGLAVAQVGAVIHDTDALAKVRDDLGPA